MRTRWRTTSAPALRRCCPVEFLCDIDAKVVNAADNAELATLVKNVPKIVMIPFKDKTLKIEVRRAKFKSWKYDQLVTTFVRPPSSSLDREIRLRFSLGKTDDMQLSR